MIKAELEVVVEAALKKEFDGLEKALPNKLPELLEVWFASGEFPGLVPKRLDGGGGWVEPEDPPKPGNLPPGGFVLACLPFLPLAGLML